MSEATTEVEPTAVAEPAEPASPEGKSEAELTAIAESKKYRGRAQTAEAELSKLQDANKQAELDQLEVDKDFKAKNELLTTDNERLTTIEKEWIADKEAQHDELLESLPEDKRESYKDFTNAQLRTVIKDLKIEPKVEVNQLAPGSGEMTDTEKAIDELTQQLNDGKISYPAYQTRLAKLRS